MAAGLDRALTGIRPAGSAEPALSARGEQVLLRQARDLLAWGGPRPAFDAGLVILFVLILYPALPFPVIAAWGALFLSLTLVARRRWLSWSERILTPRDARSIDRAILPLHGIGAIIRALPLVLLAPVPEVELRAFALAVLAGFLFASPSAYSSHRGALLVFVWPAALTGIIGLLVALALHRHPLDAALLAMTLLGLARCLRIGAQLHARYLENLNLTLDYRDLADQYRARSEALSESNRMLELARQAALKAAEAKSRFLATMSHEIRTPMNGVLGMTELLAQSPLDSRQQQMLGVIQRSGVALLRVIDDILDFSKIEAGRMTVERQPFDVAEVVGEVLELMRPRAEGAGLVFTAELGPELAYRRLGDAARVRQILINLIGNAIRFTPAGSVTVALAPAGEERLRFEIRDTGIGIAARDRDRLFQPFEQIDGSASRRHGGTGLGLSISANLVALMGGMIGVDSRPGEGSTFWFELPLPSLPAPAAPPPAGVPVPMAALMLPERLPEAVPKAEARGRLILIVEDDDTSRTLLERQLGVMGCATIAVTGGEEAWAALHAQRFGLMIADCHMPGLDGYRLVRRLRAEEAATGSSRLTVIGLSAASLPEDRARALDAGIDAYMTKPVRLAALQDMLQAHLPDLPVPAPMPVARPAPSLRAPDLDLAHLEECFGPDRHLVTAMLDQFVAGVRPSLLAARGAAAARDFDQLGRIAHGIKGSALTAGARLLADAAGTCERLCRHGGDAEASAALEAMDSAFIQVVARIDTLRSPP